MVARGGNTTPVGVTAGGTAAVAEARDDDKADDEEDKEEADIGKAWDLIVSDAHKEGDSSPVPSLPVPLTLVTLSASLLSAHPCCSMNRPTAEKGCEDPGYNAGAAAEFPPTEGPGAAVAAFFRAGSMM